MLVSLIFFLLFAISNHSDAQPSYSTSIAFRIIDEDGELVDKDRFNAEYKIANVFGNFIKPEDNAFHYYPDKGYFHLEISTIGPRFSFALYHRDKTMSFFIPFYAKADPERQKQYALDIQVVEGDYLLNFKVNKKNSFLLNSNIPFYKIEDINWSKHGKKFRKSEYAGQEMIYRSKE